jgi:hypothetical protein
MRFKAMRQIEINLLNQRPLIQFTMPRIKPSKIVHQITQAIASTALIASLTGYGALMLGRDVPCGIALGSAGTIAYLIKEEQ